MKKKLVFLMMGVVFCLNSMATEFENLYKAIAKSLKTKKASKMEVKLDDQKVQVFYSKTEDGKPNRLAIVQKRVYEPNCTHTWVVGLDAKTKTVDSVRVVEMSCPHAFPTNKASFLEQFHGKSVGDIKTLKSEVMTIAKATGSSELATDAVVTSIRAAQKIK